MLIRQGPVSNSSSTAFLFHCKAKHPKTLEDFVIEAKDYIIRELEDNDLFVGIFVPRTSDKNPTSEEIYQQLLQDARIRNVTFGPNERKIQIFGDEEGTIIGKVFDYMLRDGGAVDSFTWKFFQWLR